MYNGGKEIWQKRSEEQKISHRGVFRKEDIMAIKNEEYMEWFLDDLFLIASKLDSGWEREDLERLSKELKNHFSSTGDSETLPWDYMAMDIINSHAFNNMSMENVDEDEINLWVGAKSSEFPDNDIPTDIEKEMMKLDEEIDGGRFLWIAQTKYCGPDIRGKDYTQSQMFRKKEDFEKLVNEVDIDGKIKSLFCHTEDGQKREKWFFNAIDNPGSFYEELERMPERKGYSIGYQVYHKHCREGNWKNNFNKMCQLISQFPYKKKNEGEVFLPYGSYEDVVRILSDLVPIIEFTKDGKKRIKSYEQWTKEQLLIAETVHEKRMQITIDPYEKKAYELALRGLKMIEDVSFYQEFNPIIKEWYLQMMFISNNDAHYVIKRLNGILSKEKWKDNMEGYVKWLLRNME